MELVNNEIPRKTEQPATQETIMKFVDKIGIIARRGVFLDEYYENSDELNPKKYNGYSDYGLERLTLPGERKNPGKPFAAVSFLKIEGETHIFVGYEVSREKGELRIDRFDTFETEADRQRKTQRKKEMARFGEEGVERVGEMFKEFDRIDQSREDRRESGESLVGDPEALEVLAHLQKIDGAYGKTKSR